MKLLTLFESQLLVEDKFEHVLNTYRSRLEARLKEDHIARQLKMTPEQAVGIISNQMSQKHLVWLVRMYCQGDFRIEDTGKMSTLIDDFERWRPKLTEKDLNKYMHVEDVEDEIDYLKSRHEAPKSKRSVKQEIKKEGTRVVWEGDGHTVIEVTTEAAAKYYGKGTKWCTAADLQNAFEEYAEEGELYVFLMADGRKFQLHVESGQLMDEKDRPVTIPQLVKDYPALHEPFTDLQGDPKDQHSSHTIYQWCVMTEGDPKWEDMLLRRAPAEKEHELLFAYATHHKPDGRWPELEEWILTQDDAWLVVECAIEMITGRWKEGEEIIFRSPDVESILRYANWCLQGPLPQRVIDRVVRDISKQDRVNPRVIRELYVYWKDVVEDPWDEAAEIFSQAPTVYDCYMRAIGKR